MAADHLRHGAAHAQRQHVAHGAGVEVGLHVHRVGRAPRPTSRRRTSRTSRAGFAPPPGSGDSPRPGRCPGAKRVHRRGHGVHVLDQVDPRAVVEEAAPLRVEPDQRQVLRLVAPGLGEDAAQHARHGQDGRPHVEAEAARCHPGAGRFSTAALPPSQGFLSSSVTLWPRAAAVAAAASPPRPPPTTTTCEVIAASPSFRSTAPVRAAW